MLEEISYLVMSTFTVWPVHTVGKFILGMFVDLAFQHHIVLQRLYGIRQLKSIIWLINKYTVLKVAYIGVDRRSTIDDY